jgi:hypothetical protein
VIGFPSIPVRLDTGTANTLVYVKGRGVAFNEPTMVTIRTSSGKIEAVGVEAESGRGRTPRKFQTARQFERARSTTSSCSTECCTAFCKRHRSAGPCNASRSLLLSRAGATGGARICPQGRRRGCAAREPGPGGGQRRRPGSRRTSRAHGRERRGRRHGHRDHLPRASRLCPRDEGWRR